MRLLVCGGRDYADKVRVFAELDAVRRRFNVTLVIHGGQTGADTLAGAWGILRGVPVRSFPAQWTKYGKAAGPMRNQQMLDEGQPDLVVAFPGDIGTANMVGKARRYGVPVILAGGVPTMHSRTKLELEKANRKVGAYSRDSGSEHRRQHVVSDHASREQTGAGRGGDVVGVPRAELGETPGPTTTQHSGPDQNQPDTGVACPRSPALAPVNSAGLGEAVARDAASPLFPVAPEPLP